MKKLIFAIVVACISFLATSTTVVANEAAIVWNQGEGQNDISCTFGAGGFSGTGPATAIMTSAGEVLFDCKIKTVDQAPPDDAVRFTGVNGPFGTTCNIVITPSGRANINCH
jgi:hypothetical protein